MTRVIHLITSSIAALWDLALVATVNGGSYGMSNKYDLLTIKNILTNAYNAISLN